MSDSTFVKFKSNKMTKDVHLAHEDYGKTARPIRLAVASFSSQKVIFCFSFVGECLLHPVLFVLCVSFCFTDWETAWDDSVREQMWIDLDCLANSLKKTQHNDSFTNYWPLIKNVVHAEVEKSNFDPVLVSLSSLIPQDCPPKLLKTETRSLIWV